MDQPKSDRTSVTISKKVHREFKIRAAKMGVTQRSLLERILIEWMGNPPIFGHHLKEKEE